MHKLFDFADILIFIFLLWKYRYLGTLKSYVRNKSRPGGSIAQGYVAEECLTFCSLYLTDYVESKFNQTTRNEGVTGSTTTGLDVFRIKGHAWKRNN